ncbi:MBL fold metallo-hydrolase [Halostagnicola sp. A-GB9-2]|uniref:MBL fold metallo-hydrolase n=1 Tax=Halostagnicola sp. A-GB9-2 TaxID=3048066 RepID=UPI0024C08D49|nr:MBL fold metallo-hydrolase [Halostagnicola sp. A-GB9-2]MDJ1434403.1 MBL fold metallo-hydrolase [Halostagnicola sp. A-GB9-2]
MLESTATISRVEFSMEFPPGHVSAYVLDGDEVILFDTGPASMSTEQPVSFADQCDYALEEIDHVFLTHPHPDHVGRLRELVEGSDADVYAPLTARDRLSRPLETVTDRIRDTIAQSGFDRSEREQMYDDETHLQRWMRTNFLVDAVDHWLVDDQRVTVGERTVDAIWTPGHHADHHCYATTVDGESVLFSGDMGIEPFRAVLLNNRLDREYHNAVVSYRRSLDRLEKRTIDRIFPGHGPVHDAPLESFRDDRASLDRRIEGVSDALVDGPMTAADVSEDVLEEAHAMHFFPEILSTLTYLVNRGQASRERDRDLVYYAR